MSASDTTLTLGGFVALAGLAIAGIGLALNTASKNGELRERLTRLETIVADHIRNGRGKHE